MLEEGGICLGPELKEGGTPGPTTETSRPLEVAREILKPGLRAEDQSGLASDNR